MTAIAIKPTNKRRPGRPRKSESPLTPQKLALLNKLFLCGVPQKQIGAVIGISQQAVSYHIQNSLRPLWKEGIKLDRDHLIAEIENLKREAWEQYHSDAP